MNEPTNRAVFLDRDGTIVEDVGYLRATDDIRILPGAAEALTKLKEAGFLLLIVTNQSAVARGWLSEEAMREIEREIERLLEREGAVVDGFYYCPHLPEGTVSRYARVCGCRKPQPGLLERAAGDWDVNLGRSYAVGDSERDVEAGRRAGCRTVLIGNRTSEWADMLAGDLSEAGKLILQEEPGPDCQTGRP